MKTLLLYPAAFAFFLYSCALDERRAHQEVAGIPEIHAAPGLAPFAEGNDDLERLSALWRERTRKALAGDYPLGPGDLIEVSVPAIEELRGHSARILVDGTITLPFAGSLYANGLTEEVLRDKIRARLDKYMYEPQVFVFVKEYRNRQVAVLGAVLRPGVYSLNSEADTILDVISQAGGISPGADPRIHFIPAEPAKRDEVRKIRAVMPADFLAQDPSLLILKKTEPILINLKELAYGGYQQYLSLPVRPGDVIMVPGGGQVLVEGWVEKPGAYGVSPGLTLTGVVAAAGGPLFPADTSSVKVIRTERGGRKASYVADLDKIKNGHQPDLAVQGGDFVEVTSSSAKLVPYSLYRFFTTVVSIGVGGTVPMFR
jgi:polysaccharide biosynthesis/export protein